MQKKDLLALIESGEPVAVQRWLGEGSKRYVQKAYVVSVGNKRRVPNGGRSFGMHTVEDGVRVRFDDPAHKHGDPPIVRTTYSKIEWEDTDERIVTARHVVGRWDDVVASNEKARAADLEKRQRQQALAARYDSVASQLRDRHGYGYADVGINYAGTGQVQSVHISLSAAERFLQLLDAEQKKQIG